MKRLHSMILALTVFLIAEAAAEAQNAGKHVGEIKKILLSLKDEDIVHDHGRMGTALTAIEVYKPQAPIVINALIDLLDYRPPDEDWITHPVSSALFSIGAAAAPALIDVVKKESIGSYVSRNATGALQSIWREDLDKLIETLEVEATYAREEEAKRLRKTVESTQALKRALRGS